MVPLWPIAVTPQAESCAVEAVAAVVVVVVGEEVVLVVVVSGHPNLPAFRAQYSSMVKPAAHARQLLIIALQQILGGSVVFVVDISCALHCIEAGKRESPAKACALAAPMRSASSSERTVDESFLFFTTLPSTAHKPAMLSLSILLVLITTL